MAHAGVRRARRAGARQRPHAERACRVAFAHRRGKRCRAASARAQPARRRAAAARRALGRPTARTGEDPRRSRGSGGAARSPRGGSGRSVDGAARARPGDSPRRAHRARTYGCAGGARCAHTASGRRRRAAARAAAGAGGGGRLLRRLRVVAHVDGCARVEVQDDGVGGAHLDGGSGLRGLRDRVETLAGRLEVTSPPGHGTLVFADLPVR